MDLIVEDHSIVAEIVAEVRAEGVVLTEEERLERDGKILQTCQCLKLRHIKITLSTHLQAKFSL